MSAETVARTAATVAVVLYTFGLLTVNSYLYQLGVSDFSLLRTRFILTGGLVFIPALLTSVHSLYVCRVTRDRLREYRGRRVRGNRVGYREISMVILGVAALSTLPYVLIFTSLSALDTLDSDSVVAVATLSICLHLFIAGSYVVKSIAVMAIRQRNILGNFIRPTVDGYGFDSFFDLWVTRVALMSGSVPIIFLYIYTFAGQLYPRIPEQFGGGRLKTAELVLSEDSGELAAALGFGTTPDGRAITHRVDLIWETEQMYVVRDPADPSGRIIQIDRDAVSAVVQGGDDAPTATTETAPAATPVASPVGTP